MSTKLRTNAKNDFEKDFFKLMNKSVFCKTIEDVRNHRDIKLVITNERRDKLASEPNYHTTTQLSEKLIEIEMKKIVILMNKPIYLGQAILDISKTLMYEFRYDYTKQKYGDKAKLCYMDTDSFIILIKTEDFYKDIASDVDKWFDTSAYNENDKRPLPIGINKKVLGMFKDELNGNLMIIFGGPRAKTYSFLSDDGTEKKKVEGTKKCVIKRHLKFDDYKDSVFNEKKNTKDTAKIAISSNDKRVQTYNKITTYPYGTNAFKVCEREMLSLLLVSLKK